MYSKEELKNLKSEFWESFSAFCEVQPMLRGRKKMWMLYDTKVRGVELKFEVSRKHAAVLIELNHKDESTRLEMFERLGWHKETIERGFEGNNLTWELVCTTDSGKEVSQIYLTKEGINFHKRSDWGEYFRFMADNMYKLESNFDEIRDYLIE